MTDDPNLNRYPDVDLRFSIQPAYSPHYYKFVMLIVYVYQYIDHNLWISLCNL